MSDGEVVSLGNFGVDGLVRHTGGHTPGSITVEQSSQDALVGDLIALIASGVLIGGIAFRGRAIRPPFEDDPQTVARELERMVEGGAKRFYMGHGGRLDAREVQRHARVLSEIPKTLHPSGHCNHQSHRTASHGC